MPLPNLRNQCTAKSKRSQLRCLNPSAFGCKVCRFHGARRYFPTGEKAPNYKHGRQTKEALDNFREKMRLIRDLEEIGFKYGLMRGSKLVGRKPKV
jgi:hypothetical protein